MCILDKKEIELRKWTIVQGKIQLKHYTLEEATSEREKEMRQVYPILFQDYDKTH